MHRRLGTTLIVAALQWASCARAQVTLTLIDVNATCPPQVEAWKFALTGYCSLDTDNNSVVYPSRLDESDVVATRTHMFDLNDTARFNLYGGESCIAALKAEECSALFSSVMCFNLLPPCTYCSTYYDELIAQCPNSYATCFAGNEAELEQLYNVESLFNQHSCEGSGWRWRGRLQRWIETVAPKCVDFSSHDESKWPDGCRDVDGSIYNAQTSSASTVGRRGALLVVAFVVALV